MSAGRPPTEHEKRVVAVRQEECRGMLDVYPVEARKRHTVAVKLSDDTIEQAPDVIAALESGAHVHYSMVPPEDAPAYEAWQRTGFPLLLQVRDCPECGEKELFA